MTDTTKNYRIQEIIVQKQTLSKKLEGLNNKQSRLRHDIPKRTSKKDLKQDTTKFLFWTCFGVLCFVLLLDILLVLTLEAFRSLSLESAYKALLPIFRYTLFDSLNPSGNIIYFLETLAVPLIAVPIATLIFFIYKKRIAASENLRYDEITEKLAAIDTERSEINLSLAMLEEELAGIDESGNARKHFRGSAREDNEFLKSLLEESRKFSRERVVDDAAKADGVSDKQQKNK